MATCRTFHNLECARLCAVILLTVVVSASVVRAGVTPESPEVQKLVNNGLKFLETHGHEQLGGKCLIALAFLKSGNRTHARVSEAVKACADTIKSNADDQQLDMYSNGLAIIFLCELSSKEHAREIEWFLGRLKKRQKSHGGWGYSSLGSGDTSQSQYGALSYWEANRRGFNLDGTSVENFANWLLKTQSPEGCWGYQGIVAETETLVPQDESNCSMLAAGLGALYICADLFGMHPQTSHEVMAEAAEKEADPLPSVLRPVDVSGRVGESRQFKPSHTNQAQIAHTMYRAHSWMQKNYQVDIGPKSFYYLYGLERYKSFQEAFEGIQDESPKWYNDGFQFLAQKQDADGSWQGYCQKECDTAFSILFLLRSTQKSIHARLGEGMLLAGRGLPTNLNRAKLRNGQLVADQVRTKVDELLSMIDDGDDARLDDLARDPSQLVVENVDEKSARRFQ